MYPEKQTILQKAFPYLGSLGITAALFAALPFTQWASDSDLSAKGNKLTTVSVTPPPPAPEFEPPKEEEVREEDLELNQELQKISLNQIHLALNAGNGGMGATGFDINSFQLSDNFAGDLIFEISDLDEKPTALIRIAPAYPSKLKRSGIQGKVWLVFVVNETGAIEHARVLKSDHPDFSKSALDAIHNWKFEPGKRAGKAVKTRVRLPLSFSLRR
jgi:protein TonB